MADLYGLTYSPWTERARWALDHHRIAYRYHEHVPFLGERLLRFRARHTGRARATVPLFIDESGAYGDSFEIILRADAVGHGARLVRDEAAAVAMRDRVAPALAAGRARVSAAVLSDPEAQKEAVTAVSPALLAPLLRPIAVHGARFIAKKYGADLDSNHDRVIREVLAALRAQLGGAEGFAGPELSARDLIAISLLQLVRPVDDRFIPLAPATRRAWTSASLAEEFADLVAWRDRRYRLRRPGPRGREEDRETVQGSAA